MVSDVVSAEARELAPWMGKEDILYLIIARHYARLALHVWIRMASAGSREIVSQWLFYGYLYSDYVARMLRGMSEVRFVDGRMEAAFFAALWASGCVNGDAVIMAHRASEYAAMAKPSLNGSFWPVSCVVEHLLDSVVSLGDLRGQIHCAQSLALLADVWRANTQTGDLLNVGLQYIKAHDVEGFEDD